MKNMKKQLSVMILSLWLPCIAWAISSPVVMLQNVSDQMIVSLKKNQAQIKKDPSIVYGLTEKILVPHVDISAMSRLALGRQHWMAASEAQRQEFKKAFLNLMIRTYSSALSSYNDEQIKFKPPRADYEKQDRLKVDSVIVQRGGPSIPVSYRVFKRNDQWKVYDITVDGVSMVQSFNSQFANEIARGGMDGLLKAMKQHAATVSKK